jgi:CheY-like chemotaxis protein
MHDTTTTVLVVEDDALIRMDTVDQFQVSGFDVVEAPDASSAIEMLTSRPDIQVMFTDVDMPGALDGIMLARLVSERWPPIRIIVTSGHLQVRASDMPTGIRFYPKPYLVPTIALAVQDMIDD